VQVSWAAVNALLSLTAVVILGFGSDGRIGAQLIASFVMMFVSLYYLVKANRLKFMSIEREHYRELIFFGLPLFPHVLGGYFLNSVDRVVIGSQLDLRAAGLYAVAFQLSAAAGLVFDAINKAWQPWLFETLSKAKNGEKIRIVKYTYLWFFLLVVGGLFVSLFAQWLIVVIAGDKYEEAGEVFVILLWAQVFKGMYFGVVNYCFYVKRTGWLSLSSVLAGCIQLALLFLLVNEFGLIGAGYAYAISMALRFIVTWWLSIKMYEMPWLFFVERK
jgi:O-antigen/teichoic acid export membrane protein